MSVSPRTPRRNRVLLFGAVAALAGALAVGAAVASEWTTRVLKSTRASANASSSPSFGLRATQRGGTGAWAWGRRS